MTALLILLGAVAGAIVGSFIATLCLRWPQGVQVASGRSRCDGCGVQLGARDLVPVLSAALAAGKCRSCEAPIDPLHRQVEMMGALAGAAAVALAPHDKGFLLALFFWLLLPIAILDARHFWIPDRLSLALGLCGLALGGMLFEVSLPDRLLGGLAGFAALALVALLYRKLRGRDGLGAGDPKLLGAIALWTGGQSLPLILVLASITGVAAAIATRKQRFDSLPFGTLLCWGALLWAVMNRVGGLQALEWR